MDENMIYGQLIAYDQEGELLKLLNKEEIKGLRVIKNKSAYMFFKADDEELQYFDGMIEALANKKDSIIKYLYKDGKFIGFEISDSFLKVLSTYYIYRNYTAFKPVILDKVEGFIPGLTYNICFDLNKHFKLKDRSINILIK